MTLPRRYTAKRIVLVFLTLATVVATMYSSHKGESTSTADDTHKTMTRQLNNHPQQQQQQQQHVRPVMHTFYNPIDSVKKPAGMTHDAHDELVQVWKQAWYDAGWEPRVLTLDDAKQHPDYDSLQKIVDTLPTGEYNKLCFLRWIAMAHVGGGWMSDYDVLPIHDFRTQIGDNLPHYGSLTVHDGMCPSMVSGSAHEWLRLAKRMVEYANRMQIDSDQKTLVALRHRLGDAIFHSERQVLEGFLALEIHWEDGETCRVLTPSSMRGAHFAHSNFGKAKASGMLPADFNMDERPRVAKEWIDMWLKKCGGRKEFQ